MAPKSPPEWETLFATLRTFRKEFPARGWSWDGRFQCMTSSLPGEYAPNAEAIARRTFRDVYNARTLVHAPANIVDLCERTGGGVDALVQLVDERALVVGLEDLQAHAELAGQIAPVPSLLVTPAFSGLEPLGALRHAFLRAGGMQLAANLHDEALELEELLRGNGIAPEAAVNLVAKILGAQIGLDSAAAVQQFAAQCAGKQPARKRRRQQRAAEA